MTETTSPETPAAGFSRDDLAVLVRMAGLDPAPAQFEEMVEAYGHVRAMLARLNSGFAYAVEPCHVFTPERFEP